MTFADATSLALSRQWKPHIQASWPPKPDDHFGGHDDWAAYFSRVNHHVIDTWQGKKPAHEYMLIISYDGVFIEAVYEIYLAPKLTRRPKGAATHSKRGQDLDPYSDQQYKGFYPVRATLLRSREQIESI